MPALELNAQTAAARRAAEVQVRELIERMAPDHARLVASIRRWLRTRLPTSHEVAYEYSDAVVISFSPSGRGYEGVFVIRAGAPGVRLYFNRGKQLPDPNRLLQGSGGVTRWIAIESMATLKRPAVTALISEAIARNAVEFATKGRGSLSIRPTAASGRREAPKTSPASRKKSQRSVKLNSPRKKTKKKAKPA